MGRTTASSVTLLAAAIAIASDETIGEIARSIVPSIRGAMARAIASSIHGARAWAIASSIHGARAWAVAASIRGVIAVSSDGVIERATVTSSGGAIEGGARGEGNAGGSLLPVWRLRRWRRSRWCGSGGTERLARR